VIVLLICGSLRRGSTNAALLATARSMLPDGVEADLYDGIDRLPHFNPDVDVDPLPPAVADLRARTTAADAILVCTPEYAGALPGSFKNLLDWTVGDIDISGTPVAWINVSATGGAVEAHRSLRLVLTYTDARIIDDACADVPVPRSAVGEDGLIHDTAIRAAVERSLTALLRAAAAT
jgi:NAD(P)H-dependent FMN reductase